MKSNSRKPSLNFTGSLAVMSAAVVILFFVSMCVGRYSVHVSEVFKFLTGQSSDDMIARVITNLRIPRTVIALLAGCALSVSGAIYQGIFNNRLVSPDLLGVSSGASAGACTAILLGLSAALINLFAFVFGLAAVLLTVTIAKAFGNKSSIILVLSGIAVGGLMSSCVGLLKYLADNEMKLAEMTFWMLGDVSKTTVRDIFIILPVTAVFCATTMIFSWKLNILSLGDKEAQALGLNYRAAMTFMVLSATILTATAVAVSGTIGWIGLVVPNLVRLLVGSDNRKVIPLSMLTGAAFMMIADMAARSMAPNEIPLSVITGIAGTPLFLYAIFKKRMELQ